VLDVLLGSGKEVIKTDYLVALFEKPIGQVRPQKTGTAGNEHALANVVGRGMNSHKTGYYQSLGYGLETLSVSILTGSTFAKHHAHHDVKAKGVTMRTTITLEDELAQELHERARKTSRSFKDVVNDAVRLGLRALEHPPMPVRYAITPASMGRPKPEVNLQKALNLADYLEEVAVMQKLELRK